MYAYNVEIEPIKILLRINKLPAEYNNGDKITDDKEFFIGIRIKKDDVIYRYNGLESYGKINDETFPIPYICDEANIYKEDDFPDRFFTKLPYFSNNYYLEGSEMTYYHCLLYDKDLDKWYRYKKKGILYRSSENNVLQMIESKYGYFNPIIDDCVSDGIFDEVDDPDCDDTENKKYKLLAEEGTVCNETGEACAGDCSDECDDCYSKIESYIEINSKDYIKEDITDQQLLKIDGKFYRYNDDKYGTLTSKSHTKPPLLNAEKGRIFINEINTRDLWEEVEPPSDYLKNGDKFDEIKVSQKFYSESKNKFYALTGYITPVPDKDFFDVSKGGVIDINEKNEKLFSVNKNLYEFKIDNETISIPYEDIEENEILEKIVTELDKTDIKERIFYEIREDDNGYYLYFESKDYTLTNGRVIKYQYSIDELHNMIIELDE